MHSIQGLTEQQVQAKRAQGLGNDVKQKSGRSYWDIVRTNLFARKLSTMPFQISFRKPIALLASVALSATLLAGCSFLGMGQPASLSTAPTYKNVAYTPTVGTQKIDIYLPAGDGPFPVIINIHGGGFKFGDKGMVDAHPGQEFLQVGYALASIDYRLSGEAKFPAAVLDAKAAVRFLRANAAKYKLDPDKIVAFGQSAGGNIAAMLGTTGDVAEFDDANLGNAGVSSRVQAVVNWFGPTDFGQMDAQAKAQGCSASDQKHNASDSFESLYLGATVPDAPALVKKANPITYITKDDAPFLIQKGDQDCTVPIENTKMLADALQAAGVDVHYALLKGTGHGDTGNSPVFASASNIKVVLDFLASKLK